jgi:quinol monooxygenase YgiN
MTWLALCVPAIAFGTPAQGEPNDPRPAIFKMLASTDAKAELVETVRFKLAQGKEDVFLEHMDALSKAAAKLGGAFFVTREEGGASFYLFETWKGRDQLKQHWEGPALREFQQYLQATNALVGPPDLRIYARGPSARSFEALTWPKGGPQ